MKIFIADDEKKVRNAIRLLIESEEQNHICGEAANSQELFSYLNFCKPDLLLLDCNLPGMTINSQCIQSIRNVVPAILILIMSVDINKNVHLLNADAVICKCASPLTFLNTLHQFTHTMRAYSISTTCPTWC